MKEHSFYKYLDYVVYIKNCGLSNNFFLYATKGYENGLEINVSSLQQDKFIFLATVPNIGPKRFLPYVKTHYPELLI